MERVALPTKAKSRAGGLYFKTARAEEASVRFANSGSTLLNCVNSGGRRGSWPLGRVVNVIGDSSVGKTLLAIEGCANFAIQYPKGHIWYREAEAAFDTPYARSIGFPVERVDFGPEGIDTKWDTIEDIFEDLIRCIKLARKDGKPGLYIIDSLDALGSRADRKQREKAARKTEEGGADKGSYRLGKQRTMGEMFSELTRDLKETGICVLIISQVRANIGVTFGKKWRRSGGKALDFYASIILWLALVEKEYSKRGEIRRATGVRIRVQCTKNKMAPAYRECEFSILFGYGIDDLDANLDWLDYTGRTSKLGMTPQEINRIPKLPDDEYWEVASKVQEVVYEAWDEVEAVFAPKRRKYS